MVSTKVLNYGTGTHGRPLFTLNFWIVVQITEKKVTGYVSDLKKEKQFLPGDSTLYSTGINIIKLFFLNFLS